MYTENNILVSGGFLSLTASFDGTNFLSGRIRSFGKKDFVPSKDAPNGIRVEASIQMPVGRASNFVSHTSLLSACVSRASTHIL